METKVTNEPFQFKDALREIVFPKGTNRDALADCTVVALAYCWEMPYNEAHAILKKAGRKNSCAFHLKGFLKVGLAVPYRQFMNRGVSYHKRPGCTVYNFCKRRPKGRYLVFVDSHVISVIDGTPYNCFNINQHVRYFLYVTESFKK